MIDLLTATQDAVFAVLKAGVPANLGTVTQHVPEDWQPPLIVVGSIEATNTGTKNDPEESHSVEIVYAYRGEARRNLYAMMFAGRSAIEGATLTIPGAVFGKPAAQRRLGRVFRLWQMRFDADLQLIGNIWPFHTGYMTVPKITGDRTQQFIQLDTESYLAFLTGPSNRSYLDQGDFDPGDLSAAASIACANGTSAAGTAAAAGNGAYAGITRMGGSMDLRLQ